MIEIWLWVVLVLLCSTAYWYLTVPSGLPPGTAGLPVFGCLPFMEPHLHRLFIKLGKRYGSIYHVYLGTQLVVVLNDYTAVKEAFINQGNIYSGRPHDVLNTESESEDFGLSLSGGKLWKEHRRFLLNFLKDHGVGSAKLEFQVMNEIHKVINEVKKHNGKPFDISHLLYCSVGNTAGILVSGKSYDYDHPNITETIQMSNIIFLMLKVTWLKMCLPWLSYVPGLRKLIKKKTAKMNIMAVQDFANRIIKGVKKDFTDGNSDNFIEAYLTEMNARKGQNDQVFTEKWLLRNTQSVLGGASSTTATTITWAVMYLTNYPEIQKKIQREIDEVIGQEREPSYEDRINMPYTEATIYEVHRFVTVGPLSFPRRNIHETTLFGYRIPSDTAVMINLRNIHHDPKLWGDPENFRPDRFLDNNRQLINTEFVLPFSIGKRSCPGEPMAKFQVFLYIVSLLQQFDFVPPNGVQPTLETIPNFTLKSKAKIACAKARQN